MVIFGPIKLISSGGNAVGDRNRNDRKEILEFNHWTGSWTVIGTMKEKRTLHAVSGVSLDDYVKWCH